MYLYWHSVIILSICCVFFCCFVLWLSLLWLLLMSLSLWQCYDVVFLYSLLILFLLLLVTLIFLNQFVSNIWKLSQWICCSVVCSHFVVSDLPLAKHNNYVAHSTEWNTLFKLEFPLIHFTCGTFCLVFAWNALTRCIHVLCRVLRFGSIIWNEGDMCYHDGGINPRNWPKNPNQSNKTAPHFIAKRL